MTTNCPPIISVIMPCLNSANTIEIAIVSVLSQDYTDFELIIVDDGSTDNTLSIINKYQKSDIRIKVYKNTDVHGVSFARNIGIENALGRFICFLDSDDFLLPFSLSKRLQVIFEKNARIVYGPYLRLLKTGELIIKNVPNSLCFNDMLKRNYIGNLTGMYDTKYLGKFFQSHIRHEDYLMWCQMLFMEKFAYSTGDEPLAVYRVSQYSLSGNKFKAFIWHWNILRSGLSINFFSSVYFQFYYLITSLFDKISTRFRKI